MHLHIQFNEIQVADDDLQHQSIKERFLKQFAEKTIKGHVCNYQGLHFKRIKSQRTNQTVGIIAFQM